MAAEELAGRIGQTAEACEALGVSRSTLYRRRRPVTSKPKRRPRPQRALDTTERERVLSALHCERFVDKAPAQVWATLLDEGIYHCSIRTMYRILSEHGEVRERRNQLRHPNYQKPELVAEAPNQVWSWDITKLRGPVKWTYFYLYVILDIFSRYVTGWMLARRESAELARRLISESCLKQNIEADQLTIHADRGSSMRSKSVALLLADLGITKTHSRPYVSNDNPYSESQFKTQAFLAPGCTFLFAPRQGQPYSHSTPSPKNASPSYDVLSAILGGCVPHSSLSENRSCEIRCTWEGCSYTGGCGPVARCLLSVLLLSAHKALEEFAPRDDEGPHITPFYDTWG